MIKVLCVGKLKEKYWSSAVEEYIKRLHRYTNIEYIELPDCNVDESKIALEYEKKYIYKYINEKDFVITLEIDGIQLSSVDFSKKIDNILMFNSNIVFVVGGSYGLHNDIKNRSNMSLSFSKMTFPHQLFRVMLFEQLYRSYKIKNNEKYHK